MGFSLIPAQLPVMSGEPSGALRRNGGARGIAGRVKSRVGMREAATGARRNEGLGRRCRAHGVGAHLPGLGAHLPVPVRITWGRCTDGLWSSPLSRRSCRGLGVPPKAPDVQLLAAGSAGTGWPRWWNDRRRMRVAPSVVEPGQGTTCRAGSDSARCLWEAHGTLTSGEMHLHVTQRIGCSVEKDLLRSQGTGFQGNLALKSAIGTCWDWALG